MRIWIGIVLALYLLFQAWAPAAHAQVIIPPVVDPAADDENTVEPEAYRSGRGGYRSPAGGYTDGGRGGANPGYGADRTARNPGAAAPGNRAPAAPPATGRFGGFFGGLAAGTLLGSLLNPFGFGGGMGGVSIIGLLFWAVILYMGYSVVRGFMRNRSRQ